jgi:aconitate hydratase
LPAPKRPQDRISLSDSKSDFEKVLPTYFGDKTAKNAIDIKVNEKSTTIKNGDVVIASITSCTNTSNPSVMIGAALLAKKAVEKGLHSKPWVKTTLAPGSKVVTDYYDRAGLTPYMEKLGFNLVGYGCVTCIGNSGPLPIEISKAVNENDLAVSAVLSGNRNFEGRISPDVKMNYLASPPLVVAYALAGTMDHDFVKDSLGGRLRWKASLFGGHLADSTRNSKCDRLFNFI